VSIQDWGAIGEIVGAIGVLISLFYLAMQIRRNTHAISSNTHQSIIQQQTDVFSLTLSNPELDDLMYRGELNPDSLTDIEIRKFERLCFMHINLWESIYLNYKKGLMEEKLFQAWDEGARVLFDHSGYRSFWRNNHMAYQSEFRNHVEDFFEGD
jgi:hypothetical protein